MAENISVRKTRRLRTILAKHHKLPTPPDERDDILEQIAMAILWLDAPATRARQAFEVLGERFVDWNDLRVSVTRDVVAVLESCRLPGIKGAVLKRVLGKAVEDFYGFEFEQLRPWSRKRLAKWFTTIEGVPHRFAAAILYHVYSYDRVLVGADLARVLCRLGLVSRKAKEKSIELGLEKVIPAKDAYFVYSALREEAALEAKQKDPMRAVTPVVKAFLPKKQLDAERAAAEREAKEAAAARRRERAEAKAKAEAERKAAAEARRLERAKAKAEREAKAKAAREARAKARAKAKAEREAKAEAAAKAKAKRQAKAKAARAKAKKKAASKKAAKKVKKKAVKKAVKKTTRKKVVKKAKATRKPKATKKTKKATKAKAARKARKKK